MTARHCIAGATKENILSYFRIRSGSSFFNKDGTIHKIIDFRKSKIKGKSKFMNIIILTIFSFRNHHIFYFWLNKEGSEYVDIALIKVAPNFNDSQTEKIELYSANEFLPVPTVGRVSGWGLTENGTYPKRLRAVEIPTISNFECNDIYRETFSEGRFCAADLNNIQKSTCFADSGGAFVVKGRQAGIVHRGDCNGNKPGIYVNISNYREMIDKGLKKLEPIKQFLF